MSYSFGFVLALEGTSRISKKKVFMKKVSSKFSTSNFAPF